MFILLKNTSLGSYTPQVNRKKIKPASSGHVFQLKDFKYKLPED